MDELLKKHFDWKWDKRYHCNYCSYDTQLPNKAISHLQKKHGKELEPKKKTRKKTAPKRPAPVVENIKK
jgi:hypothetical protein